MKRNSSRKLGLSIREAALMLGVSCRTVERFVAARLLPRRKLGRRTVILVSELELFLRKDQPAPGAKAGLEAGVPAARV
jgi:excisionase family DNA binding protein